MDARENMSYLAGILRGKGEVGREVPALVHKIMDALNLNFNQTEADLHQIIEEKDAQIEKASEMIQQLKREKQTIQYDCTVMSKKHEEEISELNNKLQPKKKLFEWKKC